MRILTTLIMFLIAGGVLLQKEPEKQPEAVKNVFQGTNLHLKSGDIVLRSGKGFISDMFRNTSMHETRFSHAGVVFEKQGEFYVYHMLGTSDNSTGGLKRERLSDFCNSSQNSGYAVYRYPAIEGREKELANYLQQLSTEQLKFDEAFDLNTENALYCTEMIYKLMLNTAGLKLPLTTIKGNQYVGIDNLYVNNEAIKITEVFY